MTWFWVIAYVAFFMLFMSFFYVGGNADGE